MPGSVRVDDHQPPQRATGKKPEIDQISHGLTITLAKLYRDAGPEGCPQTRELAAQLAVIPADRLRQVQEEFDVYDHVHKSSSVGREHVKPFEAQNRRAAERAFQEFQKLPGQDSNLEKQDQNLL